MTGVLMEELVEEVLLRFPPDDPASLVRAALVTKRWCRLIAGRGFQRRFRELHHAAPMLAFICNVLGDGDREICDADARLVPTSSWLPRADYRGCRALESRYGLVLLCDVDCFEIFERAPLNRFVVWNPVTGEHLLLPCLPLERCAPAPYFFNATVLCADSDACDHLDGDCHGGRFLVVFVGTYADGMLIYVYSPESGAWGEPSMVENPNDFVDMVPAAQVGNALYFVFKETMRILKYDIDTRDTSIVELPPEPACFGHIILMTTEQGKLGVTRAEDFMLYLWSMEVGAQGEVVWTQDMVIELQNLLPADALLTEPDVFGSVHGSSVVLIGTGDGFFTVDPKLNKAIKVGEGIPFKKADDVDTGYGHNFFIVVPYTSFYFPAHAPSISSSTEMKDLEVSSVSS